MTQKHLKYILLLNLLLVCFGAQAQDSQRIGVKAVGKHANGMVWLRWSPTDAVSWELSRANGWVVERVLIPTQELPGDSVYFRLTREPVKPQPMEAWRQMALENQHAAIAAEVLYGEKLDLYSNASIQTIVTKSRETEMRFGFGIVSADQDFEVARMMGLGFVDETPLPNRIYIYRIFAQQSANLVKSDTAFVLIKQNEKYELPIIFDVKAEVRDSSVLVSWPSEIFKGNFSSYSVERGTDTLAFKPLSSTPFVTLYHKDGSGMEKATFRDDSVEFGKTYFYRVKGKDAFGGFGPPSKTQSVTVPFPFAVPSNLKYDLLPNGSVVASWEFIAADEPLIKGFNTYASQSLNDELKPIAKAKASERSVTFKPATSELFFWVEALPNLGKAKLSFPILIQLNDSIPPASTTVTSGVIDSTGMATLKWQRNTEPDFYGYKIYISSSLTNEPSLISPNFVRDTLFRFSVPLNTLSRNIYARVMSYDLRYNHSAFSKPFRLLIPDTIPPSAPVFTACEQKADAVLFSWIPSSSSDVALYLITGVKNNSQVADTVATLGIASEFLWKKPVDGSWKFAVWAVDSTGNATKSHQELGLKIAAGNKDVSPRISASSNYIKGAIELTFRVPASTHSILLYRAEADEPLRIYKTLNGSTQAFSDENVKTGVKYKYVIAVKKSNGGVAGYSNELIVNF